MKIKPKAIVIAEHFDVGVPREENGKVVLSYTLRGGSMQLLRQGSLEFAGAEAEKALSDPLAAAAKKLGIQFLPSNKIKEIKK
jgi:hypothetical protein